jgi:hypothetical protein
VVLGLEGWSAGKRTPCRDAMKDFGTSTECVSIVYAALKQMWHIYE